MLSQFVTYCKCDEYLDPRASCIPFSLTVFLENSNGCDGLLIMIRLVRTEVKEKKTKNERIEIYRVTNSDKGSKGEERVRKHLLCTSRRQNES